MMGIVFTSFIVASLLVNAALTAQFGWEHAGGSFGALIMLLFFDGAAMAWFLARMKEGLSSMQRGIAKLMSIGTIIASTLVSVIQVLLNTTLVTFSPADLQLIGKAGLVLVTVAAAANFLALFAFSYFSIEEQKAEQMEEQKARAADERQSMIQEAHTKAHTKARARLMMVTDAVADRMANDAEREFYAAMGCLDMYEPPAITAPMPPQQDQGAAAGAKEVLEAPAPLPSGTEKVDLCTCGLPVGTGAGECSETICLIDTKAEEQRTERFTAEQRAILDNASPGDDPGEVEEALANYFDEENAGSNMEPLNTFYKPGK